MAIPTRAEIIDKIDEIKNHPQFSTLQSEIKVKIGEWLDSEGCPSEDKDKILDDLISYENY